MTTLERLMTRVAKGDSCWEWQGSLDTHGYGQMKVSNRNRLVHRLAYELLVGPIPAGLVLDHLCRNTRCVNPGHLEPVTQRENTMRGVSPIAGYARQTSCLNGHEYTAESTYEHQGRRQCRICNAEAVRRYKARRKELA